MSSIKLRSLGLATLLLFGASGEALAQEGEGPRGGLVEWRYDHDAALATARREGRPVMVYLTVDW